MDIFFAVDIGGTAVKWAIITADYTILRKGEFPTPYISAQNLADEIARVLKDQPESFAGIGISLPGTALDDPDGTVKGGGNLRYMNRVPFAKIMRETTGLPCFIENDGKCGALGEYSSGALKGYSSGVVLILGTGVAGGIVIDGRVLRGAHAFAGEFSFLMEEPGSRMKLGNLFGGKCGWRKGLMDEIVSRKGLPADTEMNGHELFELVNNQDPEANAALTVFCQHLALQIYNLQAIVDPEIFAIGGGISNQPVLMERLTQELAYIYEDADFKHAPVPVVVNCQHGSDANLIGAVYNCRKRMEDQL